MGHGQTSLSSRLARLEASVPSEQVGPVVLVGPDECEQQALAEYRRRYGDKPGEPLVIRLVGLN